MMLPNPFIELFRNPVATLVALGYMSLLATLVCLTLGVCWRNAVTVYVQYKANWQRWNYVPPLSWCGRVAAIPAIIWIDTWAVAALVWLLTGA